VNRRILRRCAILSSALVVICGLFAAGPVSSARAQLAGTVWLDFVPNTPPAGYPTTATLGAETSFANALRGLNGLAGLTNGQVTTVENDITSIVQAKFGALSINITSNAGDPAAVNPSPPPGGDYSIVVLGNAAGANARVLGQANQIDWRNLSFNDSVGLSVSAYNGFTNPPATVWSGPPNDTIAQALANTVAHEIGHTLGLVHDDAAATYAATAGTDAQKKTAVQNNDLMRANVTSFNSAVSTTTAFNSYSKIKLNVASNGILLENQAEQTAHGSPGGSDPIGDSGDTNTSFATALPLVTNGTGMVNVKGNIDESVNPAAIDYFKFNGRAGQVVDLEIYSLGLEQLEGDTNSGRIPPGEAIGTSTLSLLTAGNNLLVTSPSPQTADATHTNYDGALDNMGNPIPNAYGDPLIYGYTLPADGTYFVELQGSQTGFYELFAVVPEPTSLALASIGFMAICCAVAKRWRRRA